MKKILVATGGGDCPGLNAVIRGIVKSAEHVPDVEIWGSIEAFQGVWLEKPPRIVKLTHENTGGIHVKGGTILKTSNKNNPMAFPVKKDNGEVVLEDISDQLVAEIKAQGFDAMISIGGDGSQRISQRLHELGLPIVGVPKTIDNDLSATDLTFGFSTAVQIATDSFDKLVTTAESHHRVIIMEVMGRDAGWIATHTAISGGAEICLIPEIPYDIDNVIKRIETRYDNGRGFVNIVIAEGAKEKNEQVFAKKDSNIAYENLRLGGVAYQLSHKLKEYGCTADIRETVLGHIQRGGSPIAYDRYLASLFGVKAFELIQAEQYGQMVALRNNEITSVSLSDAVKEYNVVDPNSYVVQAARKLGISFGDL